jgi:cyclohexanecarboxylate-CoA ligase
MTVSDRARVGGAGVRPTHPHQFDDGPLPDEPLGTILLETAAAHPDALAIVDAEDRISYGELASAAIRFADGLAADGVGAGDVVVAQLPNWWQTLVVAYGTFLRGAVFCPVVSIYRERELRFILGQAAPKVIVAPRTFNGFAHLELISGLVDDLGLTARLIGVRGDGFGATPFDDYGDGAASAPDRVDPELAALLLYTSGTTADPKGAIHSHQTLLYEARSIAAVARLGADDVVFMPSPLTHITGLLYGVVMTADLGCASVLMARWKVEDGAAVIEAEGCTFTVGATPFLAGLSDHYERSGRRSALRVFISGGAAVPPHIVRKAREVMGTRVVRTYGSTEMPTLCIGDPFGDPDIGAETDGRLIGSARARIGDPVAGVGELLVQGPELFLGYYDATLNEESFTAEGYFRTGDLASIRADGAITIAGRLKDVINRGGEKFSSREIEDVLSAHPAVAEVAIVGVPDPVLVERACAFVVLNPGHELSLPEVRRYLGENGLAVQKTPERLEIVPELDKTTSGKVRKFMLLADWQARNGGR